MFSPTRENKRHTHKWHDGGHAHLRPAGLQATTTDPAFNQSPILGVRLRGEVWKLPIRARCTSWIRDKDAPNWQD